jgi:hypothetical protein
MTPLPDLVPGAPVPCFMVQELINGFCDGCMFNDASLNSMDDVCTQSGTSWRMPAAASCGVNRAIFIPATREAFDAHQLELITARLTT